VTGSEAGLGSDAVPGSEAGPGSGSSPRPVDVAVIGGGPAGAAIATRLARAGHAVVLLERSPAWRWRAGGVFASPAAVAELRALGVAAATLTTVARPIPAMRVETPAGTAFELTYGAETGGEPAVGFDRSTLDPALLDLARAAGAEVCAGTTARAVELSDHRHGTVIRLGPGNVDLAPRVVIGADGARSLVAVAAGMDRPARLADRVGLTWHVADEPGDAPRPARMVVLPDGAYCGIAPVPGGRVNVGVVLAGRGWRERLVRDGAAATGEHALRSVPPLPGDPEAWREGRITDAIAGTSPLGCRVARRAGPDWLVVGDAAGFLDPFTGEGLHRALVSARLAADAVDAFLRGAGELAAYDRAMASRFGTKDLVSLLVQAFLARPRLFEHAARRLAKKPSVRATMGLVMGDLVPATRALDPRFLAGLLVP
jgi:flavin-dependent dehydrogenase